MAETKHARSRATSIIGLVLQIAATIVAILIAGALQSFAAAQLAWLFAVGVLMWLAVLLLFRQHELTDLEALDLEELRRERASTGGEGIFSEQGGFLVARARLEWMQKWLLPAIGLFASLVLVGSGLLNWSEAWRLSTSPEGWPQLPSAGTDEGRRVLALGMIAASVLLLLQFFLARYATAMSRQEHWQLLRGPGVYLLVNALATLAFVIAIGLKLSRDVEWFEHYVGYAIPIVMLLLGVEFFLLFVGDVYRPRAPGVDPRASFDSRLLGMLLMPGGMAVGLSEAVTYQFGFRVDQRWLYGLLHRWAVPLVWAGAGAVWLLTCVVIVHPHEHGILSRFGAQVNPAQPWGPGIYFKWPAPFERVEKFNTGQLHTFVVGYKVGDTPDYDEDAFAGRVPVELWADPKHAGREHFDFIIAPQAPAGLKDDELDGTPAERSAVHLMRMNVIVQYTIRPQSLGDFTLNLDDPHEAIRRIAWNEVLRFNASAGMDELMTTRRDELAETVHRRLAERSEALDIGVEVVHVGVLSAHPEKTIADAFGDVVTARQELIGSVREARVVESQMLSQVAGDRDRAHRLYEAINEIGAWELRRSAAERELGGPGPFDAVDLSSLREAFRELLERRWVARLALARAERMREEFDYGFGASLSAVEAADRATAERMAEVQRADEEYERVSAEQRRSLSSAYGELGTRVLAHAEAGVALELWQGRLEEALIGLRGDAALRLAQAQSMRWERELKAARELAVLENERFAYQAGPDIYMARRYFQVMGEGLSKMRKFLKVLDDPSRLKLRIEAQDEASPLGGTLSGQ